MRTFLFAAQKIQLHRPLSRGGHVEYKKKKKLCFYTKSLVLNLRLAEAYRAKTKLFMPPIARLNMAGDRVIRVYCVGKE